VLRSFERFRVAVVEVSGVTERTVGPPLPVSVQALRIVLSVTVTPVTPSVNVKRIFFWLSVTVLVGWSPVCAVNVGLTISSPDSLVVSPSSPVTTT